MVISFEMRWGDRMPFHERRLEKNEPRGIVDCGSERKKDVRAISQKADP